MSRVKPQPGLGVFVVVTMCLSASASNAQMQTVTWGGNDWTLVQAEVTEHLGREALTGMAFLPGSDLKDGVIEFDIAVDGTRGYPGISFHAANQYDYESFYIRPHQRNLPDALQYCPVFKGISSWQLYNGEGFNAAAPIPANEWIHIRLELNGSQGRVYVGDVAVPQLVIHDLKHGARGGMIGIRSPNNGRAFFSNFEYRSDDDLVFDPPPLAEPPLGLIKEWEISQSLRIADVDRDRYPSESDLANLQWQTVAADRNGLLDVGLHIPRSMTGEADCIFARTFVDADAEATRLFAFGYSDIVNVFINGQIVFSGNRMYKSRSASFLGAIGLDDQLYLPLEAGRNEIMFQLIETFGGWGLMLQDLEADYFAPGVEEVWEVSRQVKVPESVVYDRERDRLYVTNFFGGRGGFISKLKLDGTIEVLEWVSGLSRPTGMCFHNDRLYVIDRANLVEVNLDGGEVVQRFAVPSPRFINDVVVDAAGRFYISDNDGDRIFRCHDGEFEVWLEGDQVDGPNGLFIDGDTLLYGNLDGTIKMVDLDNKQIRDLAGLGFGSNIDGFQRDGNGNLLISDYHGRIFRVTMTGESTLVMNRTSSQRGCCDFEYIPEKELLLVPSLYDNRLTAYRYRTR